jgi:hypothetical protein
LTEGSGNEGALPTKPNPIPAIGSQASSEHSASLPTDASGQSTAFKGLINSRNNGSVPSQSSRQTSVGSSLSDNVMNQAAVTKLVVPADLLEEAAETASMMLISAKNMGKLLGKLMCINQCRSEYLSCVSDLQTTF